MPIGKKKTALIDANRKKKKTALIRYQSKLLIVEFRWKLILTALEEFEA